MTIENQTKREKMLQRVLNLRARAEDNGSSESEMNTALEMAAKLMDSYQIEEAELALAEASGRIELEIVTKKADTTLFQDPNAKPSWNRKPHRHKVLYALTGIAAFTQTKVISSSFTGDINFTGHRPDVEMANYLVALVREALDREYENYRKSNPALGRGAKASFQTAMSARVCERLKNMAEEAEAERQTAKKEAERLKIENATTASSTALVVCEIVEQKEREATAAYEKAFPKRSNHKGFSGGRNGTAHSAGRAAGNRVNFGRGVTNGNVGKITRACA